MTPNQSNIDVLCITNSPAIVVGLLILFFFLVYEASKSAARNANARHNEENKGNPKAYKATDNDAKNFGTFIIAVLATLIIALYIAALPIMKGN